MQTYTLTLREGSVTLNEEDIKSIPYFATLSQCKFADANLLNLDVTIAQWQAYREHKVDTPIDLSIQALRLANELADTKTADRIIDNLIISTETIGALIAFISGVQQETLIITTTPAWTQFAQRCYDRAILGIPTVAILAWTKTVVGGILTLPLPPVVQVDIITQWMIANKDMSEDWKLPIEEAFSTMSLLLPDITQRLIKIGDVRWLSAALKGRVGLPCLLAPVGSNEVELIDYTEFDAKHLSVDKLVKKPIVDANGSYTATSLLYKGKVWGLRLPPGGAICRGGWQTWRWPLGGEREQKIWQRLITVFDAIDKRVEECKVVPNHRYSTNGYGCITVKPRETSKFIDARLGTPISKYDLVDVTPVSEVVLTLWLYENNSMRVISKNIHSAHCVISHKEEGKPE